MKKKNFKNLFQFGGSGNKLHDNGNQGLAGGLSVAETSPVRMGRDEVELERGSRNETEECRTRVTDPHHIQELEDADKSFLNNEFDEAIALYLSAIPLAQDILPSFDSTVGDINVKISAILQGRNEIPGAIDHLLKAKQIYEESIQMKTILSEDERKEILIEKIIEVMTGVANLYVNTGEIDNASNQYKDAIEACEKYCPDDSIKLSNALNTYANFLSVCQGNHDEALSILKKALKITMKSKKEKMTVECGPVLNNMGRAYMRRGDTTNFKDAQEDAKRAEACFDRALQLYRISLLKNGSERVTDVVFNLNRVREMQHEKKSILKRNVRFVTPPSFEDELPAQTLDDDSFASSDEGTAFTGRTGETTIGFGILSLFQCGDVGDEIESFDYPPLKSCEGEEDNDIEEETGFGSSDPSIKDSFEMNKDKGDLCEGEGEDNNDEDIEEETGFGPSDPSIKDSFEMNKAP